MTRIHKVLYDLVTGVQWSDLAMSRAVYKLHDSMFWEFYKYSYRCLPYKLCLLTPVPFSWDANVSPRLVSANLTLDVQMKTSPVAFTFFFFFCLTTCFHAPSLVHLRTKLTYGSSHRLLTGLTFLVSRVSGTLLHLSFHSSSLMVWVWAWLRDPQACNRSFGLHLV